MRILAINDISCVGKCSLTVALPIVSAAGFTTDVLPTSILSTHTGGFSGYTFRDLSGDLPAILEHWKSLNLKYDLIYSGYLADISQTKTVEAIKRDFLAEGGKMVVDPVLGDNGVLYSHFDDAFVREMAKLCTCADYIVPNVTEACKLVAFDFEKANEESYPEIMRRLKELCPCPLITGADTANGTAVYYFDGDKIKHYETKKIEGAFHGSGDVYASAFCSSLAAGLSLDDAVKISADFTFRSIARTAVEVTDRKYGLNFEREILPFLEELENLRK